MSGTSIGFVLNRVKSCMFCKIIYKNDLVTKVIIRAYRRRSPNICEYDFKRFITRNRGNMMIGYHFYYKDMHHNKKE